MARKVYSEDEVKKRMEALPEAASDFLYSAEMGAIVKEIADKHHLHIDQMSLLEAEAGEFILGFVEPQEFAANIAETLKLDAQTADAVSKDMNEKLFTKVRDLMKGPPAEVKKEPLANQIPVRTQAPSTPPPMPPRPAPMPVSTPMSPTSAAPAPTTPPKPAVTHDLLAAEAMLSEKKVTPPPTPAPTPQPKPPIATTPNPATPAPTSPTPSAPPMPPKPEEKPQPYKADPYREPIE